MDNKKYLVFDIVCDYLKEKKTYASFRLISSEFKIISSDLFRRYYSVHLLNNILVDIVGLNDISLEEVRELGYSVILKLIIISCNYPYINYRVRYQDPFDPTKNTKKNRSRIKSRIHRQNSLLFSMALHYAENPRYTERYKERDIP